MLFLFLHNLMSGYGKTRNWEKMDSVEFHGLKVMRNFVRPNDVG